MGCRFRSARTLAPRYTDGEVIGLPKGAMVLTNSDRKAMWCPKKWWFSRGLGLDRGPSSAMYFGSTFDEVMEMAKSQDLFVIGGGEIYELFLPHTEIIHRTIIHCRFLNN